MEEMNLIIKKRRPRWLGHVLRIDSDRISKPALYWQMDHRVKRKPGRPSIRQDLKSIGMAWEKAEKSAADIDVKVWPNVSSIRDDLSLSKSFSA